MTQVEQIWNERNGILAYKMQKRKSVNDTSGDKIKHSDSNCRQIFHRFI